MIATVFDTETTHLIDNHVIKLDRQPHVLEIYACHVDLKSGRVFDEIDYLICPPKENDIDLDVARKSHKITWDMVKNKPRFKVVANDVMTFLSRGDAIIAHNLAFDMEILDLEYERIGLKPFWPPKKICTVEQTTWLKGTWLGLSDLHEHLFGLKFDGAHRARTDVEALVKCCIEMHSRKWI